MYEYESAPSLEPEGKQICLGKGWLISEVATRTVWRLLSGSSRSSGRIRLPTQGHIVFSLFYRHAMGLGHGSEPRHVTLGIAERTQVFFLSCPVIWKAADVQIPIRSVTS